MKDMMNIELEVGQHIFYFRPGPGGIVHEEGEVIKVRSASIRARYLGSHRGRRGYMDHGKKKGDESNIFNTTGKVFILCGHIEKERVALLDIINSLQIENSDLNKEVEKIHYRFDILDL